MELDTLAELKLNGFRRDTLPAFCKSREEFSGLEIGANQRFVDGVSHSIERVVVDALRLNDHGQLLYGNDHVVGAGKRCVGSGDEGGNEAGFGEILRIHLLNLCVSQCQALPAQGVGAAFRHNRAENDVLLRFEVPPVVMAHIVEVESDSFVAVLRQVLDTSITKR